MIVKVESESDQLMICGIQDSDKEDVCIGCMHILPHKLEDFCSDTCNSLDNKYIEVKCIQYKPNPSFQLF